MWNPAKARRDATPPLFSLLRRDTPRHNQRLGRRRVTVDTEELHIWFVSFYDFEIIEAGG